MASESTPAACNLYKKAFEGAGFTASGLQGPGFGVRGRQKLQLGAVFFESAGMDRLAWLGFMVMEKGTALGVQRKQTLT